MERCRMSVFDDMWTDDMRRAGAEVVQILSRELPSYLALVDNPAVPMDTPQRVTDMLTGRFDEAYLDACKVRASAFRRVELGLDDYLRDMMCLQAALMAHLLRRVSYYHGLQPMHAQAFLLGFSCDARAMIATFDRGAVGEMRAARVA